MPALAIHELLTQQGDDHVRKLQQTTHELSQKQQALPTQWTTMILTNATLQQPTLCCNQQKYGRYSCKLVLEFVDPSANVRHN